MKCKMKITNDTRIFMNEKEKEESLKMKCPTCGKINEPIMNEECLFFSKVIYHYHCRTEHKINKTAREIDVIDGCDTKWKIKLNPKKAFRK